jgi:hypothetical protein
VRPRISFKYLILVSTMCALHSGESATLLRNHASSRSSRTSCNVCFFASSLNVKYSSEGAKFLACRISSVEDHPISSVGDHRIS